MNTSAKVTNIMTANVHALEVSEDLFAAQDKFRKYHVRHLPVVENGKVVGMLSRTDVDRISFGNIFSTEEDHPTSAIFKMLTLEQVMKSKPITLNHNQSIKEAAEVLAKEEFHALPVVNGTDLVGILTSTDLIRFLLDST